MNYFIYYSSPNITGIPTAQDITTSSAFKDINECLGKAEHLFYNLGCNWVQIVDELGQIYTELEY
jgi:hypothetical protein